MSKFKAIFLILMLSSILNAGELSQTVQRLKKYDSIFKKYALKYNVPKEILLSVALTENEKVDPNAIRHNSNGTVDRGLMQINSIWIKELPELHLTAEKLKNPEVSIQVAAYILSKHIKNKGKNWIAYGSYHSKTPSKRKKYIAKLKKSYMAILFFY